MKESTAIASATRSIADDLKREGYSVVVEPELAAIPFDLGGYRPDILATRDDESLLVEVKSKRSRVPIERFREVAALVGQHEGWRFLVSTVGDEEDVEAFAARDWTPEEVAAALRKHDRLFAGGTPELAVPYLWSAYAAGLRVAGKRAGVPVCHVGQKRAQLHVLSGRNLARGVSLCSGVSAPRERDRASGFDSDLDGTGRGSSRVRRAEARGVGAARLAVGAIEAGHLAARLSSAITRTQ